MKHSTLAIALIIVPGLAWAQTAPKAGADPLQEICTGFLQQSGGVSGDQNKLCSCLAKETQARLTREEMVAYKAASDKGLPPPDAVMQKVLGIATACLTAASK